MSGGGGRRGGKRGGEDLFRSGVGAGSFRRLAPLAHHEHAISQRENFGQFRRDDDQAEAQPGEFVDEGVNFALRVYIDAAGGFVEQE